MHSCMSDMQTQEDMVPTQPCSLSLTFFPYTSEEEANTLQMPTSQENATSSLPATKKYFSPPPAITRYSIQSTASEHGQPFQSEEEQVSELRSTFSFVTSTSIRQSPKEVRAFPSATVRRPLVLHPVDSVQNKFASACFSGQLKTGKKAKKKSNTKSKKETLEPSFVELLKGVCGIFQAQTGKIPNLDNVCASFFQ